MQTFRKILIGMLVALAVVIPLGIAAGATNLASSAPQNRIIRIANGPTPTPTPSNGQGGCVGGGC